MASIKVSSNRAISACKKYDNNYQSWLSNHVEDKDDDCAWIEMKCERNTANTVYWIKCMAECTLNSGYPYVILTDNDFILIGKYLV